MTREQLLALGISEEQVNQIIALHGQATQSLRATVGQHEATINTLNGQLSQFQNQQPSEPTPTENPEVVELKKQIAELRSESSRKDIAVYAKHPEHVRVADTYVRPYVKDRACLDY